MEQMLMVSNLLLWILVLGLSVVVYALMRQIGVLHERVFPAGALMTMTGPAVGDPVPSMELTSWSGKTLHVGGADDAASTLILFVSPSCPVCKTLLPYLDSVARAEFPDLPLRILLASDGEPGDHQAFVQFAPIDPDRYVLSRQLGLAFLVDKLPYAVLIDEQGVLRSKGLVNSREHLESLFEARRRGVASLQDYFVKAGVNAGINAGINDGEGGSHEQA